MCIGDRICWFLVLLFGSGFGFLGCCGFEVLIEWEVFDLGVFGVCFRA